MIVRGGIVNGREIDRLKETEKLGLVKVIWIMACYKQLSFTINTHIHRQNRKEISCLLAPTDAHAWLSLSPK